MMCFVWDISAFGRKNKGRRELVFGLLMVLFTICSYSSASFLYGGADYRLFAVSETLSRIFVPAVFPASYMYLRLLVGSRHSNAWYMVYFIPSVILASIVILLWVALGSESLAAFYSATDAIIAKGASKASLPAQYAQTLYASYHICCSVWFRWLILASAVVLTCYCMYRLYNNGFRISHIFGFFRNHDSNRSNVIVVFVLLLTYTVVLRFWLGNGFLKSHKTIALLFFFLQGVLLYFLGWMEMFFKDEFITWKKTADPVTTIVQAAGTESDVAAESTSEQESDTLYAKLLASFNEMMDKDKCYLNPGITVESIAQQLGTNRVYVSRVINRTYNMTFPEYVNGRRLETAKQMLLDDPDAVLEYVALKSGFSGLSQFSRKFKEMTGVSPRAWQASQSKKK